MNQRSLSARLWARLGVATTRDAAGDAERLSKRLARSEKKSEQLAKGLEAQHAGSAAIAGTVEDLKASVATLQQALATAGDQLRVLTLARKEDLHSLEAMSGLTTQLEQASRVVDAHIDRAMANAIVSADPFPHLLISPLLPEDVYASLLDALPPAGYWRSSGQARDYWEVETDAGPWRTEAIWRFVDRQIVDQMLRPRLVQAFGSHLARYWREGFDLDPASVTYRTAEGRLQLRRKGYRLRPHLDPPHAALTGLYYLARPGDDPQYGTGLYRPASPLPVKRKGIFYPEDHGIALENAITVPFRANQLLVWMTSLGAHGADLTASEVPRSLERYTYQFQLVVDDKTRRIVRA